MSNLANIPITEQIQAVEAEIIRLRHIARRQEQKGKTVDHTKKQLNGMRAAAKTLRSIATEQRP